MPIGMLQRTSGRRCLIVLGMVSRVVIVAPSLTSYCRQAVGAALEDTKEPDELSESTVMRITNELAGRTGETDSEMEVDDYANE